MKEKEPEKLAFFGEAVMRETADLLECLTARGVQFFREPDGSILWADTRRTLTPEEKIALRGLHREIARLLEGDGESVSL